MSKKKSAATKKRKTKTKLPPKLVKYLDEHGVDHEILEHKTVYTALDAAATMRKKMDEIAKSLLVKADKDYYLVLLPADKNLDFKKLGSCIGAQAGKKIKVVKIPGEKIMEETLKIKAGTLSAFGKLHKLPVYMDNGLAKAKKAVFSGGSINHSVEMAVRDFIRMEEAILGSFGIKKKIKVQKKTKPKKKSAVKKKAAPNKRVKKTTRK
jgi:prolyl-tRNA editing enzyme YbaK/EbsC (Cys-tRNA(Pro) deacylase)